MANEITVNASLTVAKGGAAFNRATAKQISFTAAAPNGGSVSQIIATSPTALTLGDVANAGWGWLENGDATNYVDVGVYVSAVFYPLLRLYPGEAFPCRFSPGVTIYAQAHTAAVVLMKPIFDN